MLKEPKRSFKSQHFSAFHIDLFLDNLHFHVTLYTPTTPVIFSSLSSSELFWFHSGIPIFQR